MQRKWGDREIEYVHQNWGKISRYEMSQYLNLHYDTIGDIARAAGIELPKRRVRAQGEPPIIRNDVFNRYEKWTKKPSAPSNILEQLGRPAWFDEPKLEMLLKSGGRI